MAVPTAALGLGHCLSIIACTAKKKEINAQIVAICDLNKLHLDYGKKEIDEAQGGSVETHVQLP